MKIEGAQDRSPVSPVPIRLRFSRGKPAGPDKHEWESLPRPLHANTALKIRKSRDGSPYGGLLHELVQSFDEAGDFLGAGVMDEGSAQHAFVGIDTQGLDQAIGVEVPYSNTQFVGVQLRRQLG